MNDIIVNLGSIMITQTNGSSKISYMYDTVDENGNPIGQNKRQSFYVVSPELKMHIDAIRDYILTNRNNN